MKKIVTILFILQSFSLILFAQNTSSSDEFDIFKKKNQEVIALFNQKKYKDAQAIAFEVLAIAKKEFGENHLETATTYSNIGEIYRMRKKFDEAVNYFDLALRVYESDPDKYGTKLISLLKSKGTVLAFDGKEKEAERVFAKYISLAENKYGEESQLLLPFLNDQWNFYLYAKDYDKVEELFIRRKIISIKADNKDETDKISDEISCYLHNRYIKQKELLERIEFISKAVEEATKSEEKVDKFGNKATKVDGKVVNGKAIMLAKPEYPSTALARRIRGSVLVRVVIGKNGNVNSARAFCGNQLLRISAEEAAAKSRFKPTTLDGVQVEVSGIIVYNFQ